MTIFLLQVKILALKLYHAVSNINQNFTEQYQCQNNILLKHTTQLVQDLVIKFFFPSASPAN